MRIRNEEMEMVVTVVIIIITRSGARFARPLLVCEFWDCCLIQLNGGWDRL